MPLAAKGQRDEGDGGRGREEVQKQRKGGSLGGGGSCRSFRPGDTLAVLRLDG